MIKYQENKLHHRKIGIMSRIYFLPLVLLVFMLTNCLDPIELDIPKGQGEAIVINAKITKGDPSIFTLDLSQIFSFTVGSRGRIIAKNVILSDEMGNELEIEPTADGAYNYFFSDSDPIKIELGQSYKLSLETFDGRIFESTFEPLLKVPEIEAVNYNVYEKTLLLPDQSERVVTFIAYDIDTQLQAEGEENPSFLKWELQRVYKVTDSPIIAGKESTVCYVDGNAGVFDILIYNGEATTLTELSDYFIYEEPLERSYGEGLYFTVIQESLSKGAYEYWERVSNVLERKDNIYADPPGKIKSNFTHINGSEEAFGYFYLTVQDTSRIYVDPEVTGVNVTRCPSDRLVNMDGSCGDPLCCDCLSVDNSTDLKPAFWTQ